MDEMDIDFDRPFWREGEPRPKGMALLLATVGTYGVVAFTVSQRRREMGLRIALGAESRDIAMIVLGNGLAMALLGVTLGIIGAVAASRFLASLLFEVSATDPAALLTAGAVLTGAVMLACYVPARRAARVDPTTTLRCE